MDRFENILKNEKYIGGYDCGQGVKLQLYENIKDGIKDNLSEILEASGYELFIKSDIDFMHSETYIKDSEEFIINYSSADKSLRIIKDSYTKKINRYPSEKGCCPVKLWQFEIDHSLIDCGMCYIIQCSDFSFFVIDSAHIYSVNDDIRIYEFMKKHTPEGRKVKVSGWFFSHGHVDHIGKFCDILKYNKDIEIDGFYYNFVPLDHRDSGCWMPSDKNHAIDFIKLTEDSKIPIYKLHTGQYFYIDCLRFDVLCTHEDVYPRSLENFNDSSTVIMMTLDEDKVCFPGDAGYEESMMLEKNYNKFLSCDIMQASHHGHFGTTENFYKLASADVMLFPVTKIKFDEDMPRYKANETACNIAEYTFIASDGTVEFTFPLENSGIVLYPDETFENFEGIKNLWSYDYTDEYKNELIERYKSRQRTEKFKYHKSRP